MTPAEKSFLRYWEEQRQGGKRKYLLTLVPFFTFCILAAIFLAGIVMDIYWFFYWPWPYIAGSVVIAAALCYYMVLRHWDRNEARWQQMKNPSQTPLKGKS